jgi:O-methyltransferase involved in polyketide biosynthesis
MYDWYLGGGTNYAIDREFGKQVLDVFPIVKPVALANRLLLQRFVRHLATQGVRQFVDLGSGVPTVGNVHQIADEVDTGSRVVYTDNEPVAVAHSELLLDRHGDPERHAVVNVDLRDPDEVWRQVKRTGVVDTSQPVGLLMIAVLHFVHDEVDDVMRRYRDHLPAGSHLAISHATKDGVSGQRAGEVDDLVGMYERTMNPLCLRTHEQVRGLFGDFELLEPGVVWAPEWHAEERLTGFRPPAFDDPSDSIVVGGAARKG